MGDRIHNTTGQTHGSSRVRQRSLSLALLFAHPPACPLTRFPDHPGAPFGVGPVLGQSVTHFGCISGATGRFSKVEI